MNVNNSPLNSLKKVLLVMVVILLLYIFFKGKDINNQEISQDFIDANNELIESSKMNDDVFLDIRSSSNANVNTIMKRYNIKRVIFHKSAKRVSVRYSFGDWLYWLNPSRYYLFSSDGYTEEYQVKSIKQSVENGTESFYHFCQKLDRENWFYCESQS
ncbi:hypothetical protein [Vibrio proteolyticus]